jgi:spermidine synthase
MTSAALETPVADAAESASDPRVPPTRAPRGTVSADGRWFVETLHGEERRFELTSAPQREHGERQDIALMNTVAFGRMLVIDGETHSSERDEFVYHEALVQPALLGHPHPRRVLVIGCGGGATLREVLRRADVEHVVMLDADPALTRFARSSMDSWHCGAFDDPRVELITADGFEYLRARPNRFDVIVIDVCNHVSDPAAASACGARYFAAAASGLAAGGILAMQAGALSLRTPGRHGALARDVASAFPTCIAYSAFVESRCSEWSFLLAGATAAQTALASGYAVDRRIARYGLQDVLQFYDGASHERMFRIPKHLKHRY